MATIGIGSYAVMLVDLFIQRAWTGKLFSRALKIDSDAVEGPKRTGERLCSSILF